MKKLAGLMLLAGMMLTFTMVCHADSGLQFEYNNKTYTLEQVLAPESGFPFEVQQKDGGLQFTDNVSGLTAAFRLNSLDRSSFEALRKYYNDEISTSDELFEKYIGLQKSYIPALQDLYRNSFLYGDKDNPYSESNMKLFYQGTDYIFGQTSDVFLYNIINSDRLKRLEETHLDIIIPISDYYSLINVNVTVKTGQLNAGVEDAVSKLLGCIRFNGLPVQTDILKVFGQKDAVEACNAGVYPASEGGGAVLEFKDAFAGFSFKYPAAYSDYMQNSVGGKLFFKSFKIDPNDTFSVSSELTDTRDAIKEKIACIKENDGSVSIKEEGTAAVGDIEFEYLGYELKSDDGVVTYVRDYFTARDKRIYNLRLSSRFAEPSSALISEFEEILNSFSLTDPEKKYPAETEDFAVYSNKEEGYSFIYPDSWRLTDLSKDINYDSLSLKMPELSGPIDFYFSEGELSPGINSADIPACLSGTDTVSFDRYIKKYTPPYTGAVKKLLYSSSKSEGGITYVYKLINYLDSNGRTRLCYSMDIVKNYKIYSMFISLSEYASSDGRIADPHINSVIDIIASSFKYEETYESKERADFGEKRNRKVVQLENIVRQMLGSGAKVTQAVNAGSTGSYYLTVENIENSGYYRVKPDFIHNSAVIEERTLKNEILDTELAKIYDTLKHEKIISYSLDDSNMTLSVRSHSSADSASFTRTYQVKVDVSPNGVLWETIYKNHASILKKGCKAFLEGYLSTDVDINFASADEFEDIETYRKSNDNYSTAVYAEFKNKSGFFTLEINPRNDNINLVSFKPTDNLFREVSAGIVQSAEMGFITDYSFNGSDFAFSMNMYSIVKGEFTERYKIKYNPDTLLFEYEKE